MIIGFLWGIFIALLFWYAWQRGTFLAVGAFALQVLALLAYAFR